MHQFISILRGINVSGQKKILMADLKTLYNAMGFSDVVTYIQSGNIIFKTDKSLSEQDLARQIEQVISEQYKFEVPVIVRSVQSLKNTISNNPFIEKSNVDIEKMHVTFLAEAPSLSALEAIHKVNYPPDEFIIVDKEIYLHCPVNYGETKLSNSFFENKLKVKATTRNWKTVNKLLELAVG